VSTDFQLCLHVSASVLAIVGLYSTCQVTIQFALGLCGCVGVCVCVCVGGGGEILFTVVGSMKFKLLDRFITA
jgi:hypothetical protein